MAPRPYLLACVASLVVACGQAVTHHGRHESDKPTAPVSVQLAATPLGAGRYDVTMTAIPTVDTPELTLAIALPRGTRQLAGEAATRFGRTSAGTTRTLTVSLELLGTWADLAGSAAVRLPSGATRSRAATTTLGRRPIAEPVRPSSVTLPNGDTVAEVRP